ncbi:MAG TPA: YceI family protein [Pseudoxanthomonas sp.]
MTEAMRLRRWICGLALLCLWPAAAASADSLDPALSRLGFELSTRWGTRLSGVFRHYEGGVRRLPDGRHQVHLRMFTRSVEIEGHPRYSEWTRGPRFFESDRYPAVTFVSRPYSEDLLRRGGQLLGELSIRGITRPETLTVAPSTCARPARDCAVVASGAVQRSDYGMDNWMMAVNDRVVFVLRARLHAESGS